MKKRLFLTISAILLLVGMSFAGVTIRYSNKDSKSYTMTVKIGGSTQKVEFESGRTASITIQGGSSSCIIQTSCGSVTVSDNTNIKIENGCIKIQ